MDCVVCGSTAVTERPGRTARGHRRFRCRECRKQYNERSGGLLNHTQYPSDVIALVVLWRLRYRLTLRDLAEMFLQRGIIFSHEAVREREAKLAPLLADELRQRRHGKRGTRGRHWHVDETYLKVRGRWCYLYRAIDRDGNLVDTMLSKHRDMAAAQAFFRSARAATGVTPERITTDGHGSYPRAIRSTLGRRIVHRTSAYKNNRLEQDHRGVKGRAQCMRSFKGFTAAERFCRGYDELRNFLRPRTRHNQHIPANRRRLLHVRRTRYALAMLEAASAELVSHLMPSGLARVLTEPCCPGISGCNERTLASETGRVPDIRCATRKSTHQCPVRDYPCNPATSAAAFSLTRAALSPGL